MTRIGLIGGLSWKSTAAYYSLLNQLTAQRRGAWQQPQVLIDSVNFADIVQFQLEGNWAATGEILAQSARRLESGGAEVLGISANTMHMNYDDVRRAVSTGSTNYWRRRRRARRSIIWWTSPTSAIWRRFSSATPPAPLPARCCR